MNQSIENLFSLEGKVAVITGGGGVLGGAMAEGIAEAGAKVVLLGRTMESLETQADKITRKGGKALPLVCNVLNEEDLIKVRDRVLQEWSKIDILLNVAGGNMPGATITPDQTFFDLNIKDFDKVVALNLKGTVLPSYVFCEPMAKSKSGSIINISSLTSTKPFTRVVGYNAAKAAIDNFTKWLAVEMCSKFGSGIRVNAIAPGVFVGKQNHNLLYDAKDVLSSRGQSLIDHTPMGRFGEPDELAGTAIYLCSEAARFVTGAVVPVDGGFLAYAGV
jgi:NAD(P)-dependent dehydrogenase (short-subunit alcohol dehydrogenase family)